MIYRPKCLHKVDSVKRKINLSLVVKLKKLLFIATESSYNCVRYYISDNDIRNEIHLLH